MVVLPPRSILGHDERLRPTGLVRPERRRAWRPPTAEIVHQALRVTPIAPIHATQQEPLGLRQRRLFPAPLYLQESDPTTGDAGLHRSPSKWSRTWPYGDVCLGTPSKMHAMDRWRAAPLPRLPTPRRYVGPEGRHTAARQAPRRVLPHTGKATHLGDKMFGRRTGCPQHAVRGHRRALSLSHTLPALPGPALPTLPAAARADWLAAEAGATAWGSAQRDVAKTSRQSLPRSYGILINTPYDRQGINGRDAPAHHSFTPCRPSASCAPPAGLRRGR